MIETIGFESEYSLKFYNKKSLSGLICFLTVQKIEEDENLEGLMRRMFMGEKKNGAWLNFSQIMGGVSILRSMKHTFIKISPKYMSTKKDSTTLDGNRMVNVCFTTESKWSSHWGRCMIIRCMHKPAQVSWIKFLLVEGYDCTFNAAVR